MLLGVTVEHSSSQTASRCSSTLGASRTRWDWLESETEVIASEGVARIRTPSDAIELLSTAATSDSIPPWPRLLTAIRRSR